MDGFEWLAATTTSTTLENFLKERYFNANMDSGSDKGEILSTEPGPGQALQFGDNTNDFITVEIPTTTTEVYISFRCKFKSIPFGTSADLVRLFTPESAEALSATMMSGQSWKVNRQGSIEHERFNPADFYLYEWNTIEFYGKIDNSAGAWELRINGTTYSQASGLDTLPVGSTAQVDRVAVTNIQATGSNGYIIRDLIINDASGSVNNSWIGQQKHVYTIFPNADGDNSQWTRSTGTTDYTLIDEVNHNGNTDYIEESTTTNKTLVNMEASGGENNILGVSVHTTAALDAAGSETYKNKVKENVTEGNGANKTVASTTYAQFEDVFETNPDTSAAWDDLEIDAMQAGVEYV
jgi:hypothetical protein